MNKNGIIFLLAVLQMFSISISLGMMYLCCSIGFGIGGYFIRDKSSKTLDELEKKVEEKKEQERLEKEEREQELDAIKNMLQKMRIKNI